jgi:hypothetical protein
VDGEYVDGPVNDAQVVARFGHTSVKARPLRSQICSRTLWGPSNTIAFSAYPLRRRSRTEPPLG